MHKCMKHPCPKPETCKCRTVREANVPIIWLIGGTGSGKNTIGTALTQRYRFDFVNSGDLLRQEVRSGSRKGQAYERAILDGRLVDDTEIVELLERTMRRQLQRQSRGYVVSFAKTLAQAQLFEKYIAPVDLVLHLDCSDDTMLQRSLQRAAEAGVAANAEDTDDIIRVRMQRFRTTVAELLEHYKDRVREINTEAGIEEVMAQIGPIVDEVTARKLSVTPKPTCDPAEVPTGGEETAEGEVKEEEVEQDEKADEAGGGGK